MENGTQAQREGTQIKLDAFVNAVVTVSVKDGRRFRGKLTQYDEHMNLLLEDVEEISESGSARHKLVLLKGGNVSAVSV